MMTQTTATHTNTPRCAHSAVRVALRSRICHTFTRIEKSGNLLPVKGWTKLKQGYAAVGPKANNPRCSNALGQKHNLTYPDGAQYSYMGTLSQSVVSKVPAGETTFKEINRVTFVE